MNKSVIVYGPQGCGKTRNADKIAKAFGLNRSEDLEDGNVTLEPEGVLYLTNFPVESRAFKGLACISYNDAMRKAGHAARADLVGGA